MHTAGIESLTKKRDGPVRILRANAGMPRLSGQPVHASLAPRPRSCVVALLNVDGSTDVSGRTSSQDRKPSSKERLDSVPPLPYLPRTHTKFASSAESMGRFWFGKSSERVIEGDFHRFIGPKPVGSSGHHSNFVVEAFDRPSRNLSFGAEPVQQ